MNRYVFYTYNILKRKISITSKMFYFMDTPVLMCVTDKRLAIRSLPACSITKFKSLTDGNSNNSNSDISNYQIQIRSASVDFIHFAFGVEVTDDERDQFESIIRELRSSTVSPLDVFAFRQCPATLKYTTFRIKPKSNVKGIRDQRITIGGSTLDCKHWFWVEIH